MKENKNYDYQNDFIDQSMLLSQQNSNLKKSGEINNEDHKQEKNNQQIIKKLVEQIDMMESRFENTQKLQKQKQLIQQKYHKLKQQYQFMIIQMQQMQQKIHSYELEIIKLNQLPEQNILLNSDNFNTAKSCIVQSFRFKHAELSLSSGIKQQADNFVINKEKGDFIKIQQCHSSSSLIKSSKNLKKSGNENFSFRKDSKNKQLKSSSEQKNQSKIINQEQNIPSIVYIKEFMQQNYEQHFFTKQLEKIILIYEQKINKQLEQFEKLQQYTQNLFKDCLVKQNQIQLLLSQVIQYENQINILKTEKKSLYKQNKRMKHLILRSEEKMVSLGKRLIELTEKQSKNNQKIKQNQFVKNLTQQ